MGGKYTGNKAKGHNPLRRYFEQPKICKALPSRTSTIQGIVGYATDGATCLCWATRTELSLKTPDALLKDQQQLT